MGAISPDLKEQRTLSEVGSKFCVSRQRVLQRERHLRRRLRGDFQRGAILVDSVEEIRAKCIHAVNITFVERLLGWSFETDRMLIKLFVGVAGTYVTYSQYALEGNYSFTHSRSQFTSDLDTWLRADRPSSNADAAPSLTRQLPRDSPMISCKGIWMPGETSR